MDDITKLIDGLKTEVKQDTSLSKEEKELQLIKLQEVALKYTGDDELISSADMVERIKNAPPEKKYMSGFEGLDDILDGFREQQVVVLAAPTKSGKTSFSVDLTKNMEGTHPLWLFFEESPEEIVRKFMDRGEEPPEFYAPARVAGDSLEWIEKRIVEAVAKHDTKLVIIDHLHFIVPFTAARMDAEIGRTMRQLNRLAKRWNVIIVLVAHLRKTKLLEQPDLEDLRDSSFVAQEADTVLMLWRRTGRDNGKVIITDDVNLSVQANRRTGKTGNVSFVFKDGRFIESDWAANLEAFDNDDF
jgi:replicative DNA helicase